MPRPRSLEIAGLVAVLALQAFLLSRLVHTATNYDEDVYLAAVDALRHGQSLGSEVFAAQWPGFYDLVRFLSYVTGLTVAGIRSGMIVVTLAGTVGAWLVGRRYGGPVGGLLTAGLLVVAPPLDLFGWQVLADPPALSLTVLALGLATLPGTVAAVAAGAIFGAAFSIKLTALTAGVAMLWLLRGRLLPAFGGFVVPIVVALAAHAGALGDLWTSGVTYHRQAGSTPAVIAHPHRQIFHQIPHTTPFFVLAVVAVVVGVAFAVVRRPLGTWPLWTWVVLSLAFLFVYKPLHDNHLILFPFALAVAAGATLGAALERAPRAAAVVVALAVALGYVQQLHRVDGARTAEPASLVAAAQALGRLTAPGTKTIDDQPIISFLAHRRVLGKLVDLAELRFETGSLTDAQVVAELPDAGAVVVSRSLRGRAPLRAALKQGFRLAYDRGGVAIYLKRPRT
jgi:hypothetical protein